MVEPADCPSPGAQHGFTEARAIARVACAAGSSPVIAALVHHAGAEAAALMTDTIDIVRAWVAAIAGHSTLTGEKVDAVIAAGVAERSIKLERQRREDWRQREQSALTARLGMGSEGCQQDITRVFL
jgi:hypothetical protein